MKAVFYPDPGNSLQLEETEIPIPQPGQVQVRIQYAALNHLDLYVMQQARRSAGLIGGADCSGIVTAVGAGADPALVGREVLVNPGIDWGSNEEVQDDAFRILGADLNGSFAEYVVVPAENVFAIPSHLSLREAAALPMAAVTAYRALFTKGKIRAGEKLLITGIGGGVALFLLQFGLAAGAQVFVTSGSGDKIKRAKELGATAGFNYKDTGWVKAARDAAGGFHLVVDTAGGEGFAGLSELANPAGRIVVMGRTAGNITSLSPSVIFNKQLHLVGSLMGSNTDFRDMLDFVAKHRLMPLIDREFSLAQIDEAFRYMHTGSQFGKLLINVAAQ